MNEEAEQCYGPLARRSQFAGKLRHTWDLLVRRWWVLALGLICGVAVEIGIARFQGPAYVSTGQMIVNVKLAIPQGSVFTEELSNFLGTQAALMQSEVVVNRAYSRACALLTNLPPAMRPVVKVSITPRTTIFNLQATGSDPRFTQQFLQATMEEYSQLKKDMRRQASDSTLAGMLEQVFTLEKEATNAQALVTDFQRSHSMVWIEEQGNNLANHLSGLNQRLEALKSEYGLLQSLTFDQNVQRQDTPGIANDVEGATNAVANNNTLGSDYLKAKQQLLLMKAEQQELSQYLRPKHPKMVAMSEDVARRERLLEIYRQQNVEQLEGRKATVALQIQSLQKEIKDWEKKLAAVSEDAAEYQRLKSEAQRAQALYQQLAVTHQTVDVNKEVGAETVSIMESASPAMLDERRARNNLVFAGIACVVATLALLLFLERLDDRVNSLSELQELFEEPVLAQIPKTKRENGIPKLLQSADERHTFVEAYRNLRSSLLYLGDPASQPKTLLLTSTRPSEGKSLTAANLSLVLAAGGSRVLLVDADLRKGVLHSRFKLPEGPGLSEVLAEGRVWRELVRPTYDANLGVLSRGERTNNSSELFLRPATRQFLKESAEAYDFVILDMPPVLAVDDVTTLAPHADGVLFVLRAQHTSARVAHAALDLLCQRKARVLGIVFNAVRPGNADYYAYKYEDYYTAYPAK